MESAEASMKTITGTVAYRERIALPPHAVVTVALEDVSLADAPAKVLAKQTFETEGKQVPLAFELSYNSNDIKPNHRYSLRARIEVDGKLRFINDTSTPVITDAEQTHEANIRLVGTR
jgi:putative lipoprotein